MKKLMAIASIVLMTLLAFSFNNVMAQEAPTGTWFGSWPYVLPPDHHLNSFASGGLNDNLGVVYRPLVELSPAYFLWATSEYTPILAESWGFTDDGKAYTYTLKSGAKWSNDDPITSKDVVDTFAIGRMLGWTEYSYISTVEAVDDLTTKFTFIDQPSLLAERLILKESIVASANYGPLAEEALALFDSGATKDDQAWADLVTKINEFRPAELIASGPYTYTLDDVGDAFMTLHWQPNSIFSDSVKFGELKLWAGETEQTAPLVLNGSIGHSTDVYPPATVDAIAAAGIRLVTTPRGYGPSLLFNFDRHPFEVKEVRQAIAYVIDRDQSAFLTNGLGAAGTRYMSGILDSLTPQLMSEEGIAKLNPYVKDLTKAEELMTTAGYTRNADGKWADADGNTISVEYTFPQDFADFSAAAQDATSQLNDFGFDIQLRALPWQDARDAIYNNDFDLSVWSWGAGSPFASPNFRNPTIRFNGPGLAEGQKGIDFPLQFDYNGTAVDLLTMIPAVSNGIDVDGQKARADEVAGIINDVLPFIPLNEMLSVEPVNEALIGGAPADGDPIYANPSSDHFIILLILNGTLFPVT